MRSWQKVGSVNATPLWYCGIYTAINTPWTDDKASFPPVYCALLYTHQDWFPPPLFLLSPLITSFNISLCPSRSYCNITRSARWSAAPPLLPSAKEKGVWQKIRTVTSLHISKAHVWIKIHEFRRRLPPKGTGAIGLPELLTHLQTLWIFLRNITTAGQGKTWTNSVRHWVR